MKIEEFRPGSYQRQFQYRSFQPETVNQPWTWETPEVNTLLAEASRHLGELNGLSLIVPNIDRFITMHVAKEAQTSSRIEGTRTEMDEAIQDDPDHIAPEKRDDWQEVRNYIAAINQAVTRLRTLPLSNRLLCEAHATLLSGVRGERRAPGEFRRSQNWIGGASLADAAFIPPRHEEVPALMSDLEALWHNEEIAVPDLIRIAISHYQFETIHPFLDGNGRIGRLLIALYLVSKGLLRQPCLYISAHLEKHRASYYDALTAVRTRGDLLHWIKFFLVAVNETSKTAGGTMRAVFELRQRLTQKLGSAGSPNAGRMLDLLFQKPHVTASHVAEALQLSQATVSRLLAEFVRAGVLHPATVSKRPRSFLFKEYVALFDT